MHCFKSFHLCSSGRVCGGGMIADPRLTHGGREGSRERRAELETEGKERGVNGVGEMEWF